MKKITCNNLGNEAHNLWRTYQSHSGEDPENEHFTENFWANYKGLIAKAKEAQQTFVAPAKPAPIAAKPVNYAPVSVWDKVLDKHWQGLPSVVHCQQNDPAQTEGCTIAVKVMITLGLLLFTAVTAFISAVLVFLGVTGIILLIISINKETKEIYHSFDFQPGYLIYRKKVVSTHQKQVIIQIRIPYETIHYVQASPKQNIMIRHQKSQHWTDNKKGKHYQVIIPENIKFRNHIYRLLQEIVIVNKQNSGFIP